MIRPGGKGSAVAVNAIEKAFKVCAALRELEEEWGFNKNHPLLPVGHSTLGPNVIRGGPGEIKTPFIIPDTCSVDYCIWYPPHIDVENIKQEIEGRIQWVSAADEWLRDNPPQVDWKFHWTRYAIPEDHEIIKTVAEAHEAVTGESIEAVASPAVVDASFMKPVPSICYGTGGAGLFSVHGVDEFVDIDDLIRATKTLAISILDWCDYERVQD
jgi:acetylornithine deacetylase